MLLQWIVSYLGVAAVAAIQFYFGRKTFSRSDFILVSSLYFLIFLGLALLNVDVRSPVPSMVAQFKPISTALYHAFGG